MRNPALRQRGQDVLITMFDGTATTVKGVIGLAETSAGEATQPFGDFGALIWIDYDGDPMQVEFCEYIEPGTGARIHRRVTKRERVGDSLPTIKCSMSSEATVLPHLAQFSRRDFSPLDFATD